MFSAYKKTVICLLPFITALLLSGCTHHEQASQSLKRALDQELTSNQQLFLNKSVLDVLNAFQRQPTSINAVDKKHNVVWFYEIHDRLIDPKTGNVVNPPGQFLAADDKIHWQEYYYTNVDGIVYDIKIDSPHLSLAE